MYKPTHWVGIALFLGVASFAKAQTLSEYIHLRHKYGISAAAGVPALDTLVGTRTVEIAGTVHGMFKYRGKTELMVERPDGKTDTIEAVNAPDWLEGNEIHARLLIQATRPPGGELSATLLAAAAETTIAAYDEEQRQAELAASRKVKPVSHLVVPKTARERKLWTLPRSQVTPLYAAYIKKQNSRLSNAEATKIASAIVGFSLEYGVDARLIMAMVFVESGFDPHSTSHSGAMGLGQLMPGTARWMGVTNAYDTTDNLFGTVKLVRTHLSQYQQQTANDFESLRLTLAAYNAGEGAVARHGGVPPFRETQAYVKKVIRLYYQFCGVQA